MLFLATTTALWGLALATCPAWLRARAARRRQPLETARRRWFSLAALLLACCWTLLQPPVYYFADQLLGLRNFAQLVAHTLAVAAAWCIGRWLMVMPSPRGPATRLGRLSRSQGLALATTIALVILWAITPHSAIEEVEYVVRLGDPISVPLYRILFYGYLAIIGVSLCSHSWSYRQVARQPLLRRALTLQTGGWAVGVLYLVQSIAQAVLQYAGGPYPADQGTRLRPLLLAATILGIGAGRALPLIRQMSQFRQRRARYRAYQQLEPLARALHVDALPTPALGQASCEHAAPLRDLDLQVHFLIVGIRDGAHALSGYITPQLLAQAQWRAGEHHRPSDPATIDGFCIALGLQARATMPPQVGGAWHLGASPTADLASEAAYLQRVARAWQTARPGDKGGTTR